MTTLLRSRPTRIRLPYNDLTRRRFLGSGAAVGAGLLIGGCANDSGDEDPVVADSPTPTATVAPIEHIYGTTVPPVDPQRVVSIGYQDQDTILALGVVPVATREWFGEQPFATWPWARDRLGDGRPTVLSAEELNFETIASLRPDLIIGISSGMLEADYAKLSQIAPTVAAPAGDDYSWQEGARIIGRALGRLEMADQLIAEVEQKLADARRDHPEFAGHEALFANANPDFIEVYSKDRKENQILADLGFQTPSDFALPEGELSFEQLGQIDRDVVLWYSPTTSEPEILANNEVYQGLDIANEGRSVFLNYMEPLAGAIGFGSVLSIPYALDLLVPVLIAALDGDPDTTVSTSPSTSPSEVPTEEASAEPTS